MLIFIGYFNIDSYYNLFGINIYPYLDISEVLFNVLTGVNYFILLGVIIILTFTVPSIFINNSNKIKDISEKIEQKKVYKVIYSIVLILFSLVSIFYNTWRLIIDLYETNNWIIFIAIFPLISIFLFYLIIKKISISSNWSKATLKNRIEQIITIVIIMCFYSYFIAYSNYKLTIINVNPDYIIFDYNNTKLESSESFVFVGSTKNYIFMHDTKSKLNYIYERDEVSNLKIASSSKFLKSNFNMKRKKPLN